MGFCVLCVVFVGMWCFTAVSIVLNQRLRRVSICVLFRLSGIVSSVMLFSISSLKSSQFALLICSVGGMGFRTALVVIFITVGMWSERVIGPGES